MVGPILPPFQGVVKVRSDSLWTRKHYAVPVSSFLLGLQTIWAHVEYVGLAPYASPPSIQNVRIDHHRAHIPMAEQLLDRPDVEVANE